MSKTDLTAGALRELLHYNPESGIFTWLVAQGGASIGAVAGSPNERGYWKIKLCGRAYGAHRLAWLYCNGAWPSFEIDHHDQDKSNNRIANLRPATRSQNSQNKSLRCDNKSGLRGVSWYAKSGKWCAQIGLNGRRKNLGYFESKEDAYNAYLAAAATMHTHNPLVLGPVMA